MASEFDNKCMECIYEGFAFCSSDSGVTGSCLPADCSETKEEQKETGKCTSQIVCPGSGQRVNLAFSGCRGAISSESSTNKFCGPALVIKKSDVENGTTQVEVDESITTTDIMQRQLTVPAQGSCAIDISAEADTLGAFNLREWNPDIMAVVTKLDQDQSPPQIWDSETSQLSNEATFELNAATGGQIPVGKVPNPVDEDGESSFSNISYKLVLINKASSNTDITLIFGGAAGLQMLVSTLALASIFFTAYTI